MSVITAKRVSSAISFNDVKGFLGLKKLKRTYATEAQFQTRPYKLHRLDSPPPATVKVTKEEGAEYYRQMYAIRALENATFSLYKAQLVRGFCHLYSGEEAVAVGCKATVGPKDLVVTPYRIHGWAYIMGISALGILAEMAGKVSACQRGKGGSMHLYGHNYYGGLGIVGSSVPVGTGLGFALKYRGIKAVSYAVYGDGAANQGQAAEAFNIAKLWKIPTIFFCENNGYGYGTAVERAAANPNFYTRGDTIPGIRADGMDVITVREATKYAKDYCLSGKGPIVVECVTYRYSGHSVYDPSTSYRTLEEVAQVRKERDPITNFKKSLISSKLLNEKEIEKIEMDAKTEMVNASEKAASDPIMEVSDLTADVYSKCLEPSIRNTTPFNPLYHKRRGKAFNLDD